MGKIHIAMYKDAHVVKIEYLKEPLVTNITKQYYQDSDTNRYYNVAHLSNGDIVVFELREDGKYQNIPWFIGIFTKKVNISKEKDFVLTAEKVLEQKETKKKQQQEEWENTAYLPSGDYIESTGFTRGEGNLDYMLEHYGWDIRNKTLMENIEFDAHRENMYGDIHVIRIEHLTEPLVTNISKKLFPDSNTNRYYWVAHTNSDNIVAFNLRDDGKYQNIPWSLRIFINKISRFV
jgi:hypothetical protein